MEQDDALKQAVQKFEEGNNAVGALLIAKFCELKAGWYEEQKNIYLEFKKDFEQAAKLLAVKKT